MSGPRALGLATSILLHGVVVVAVAAVIPRADLLPPLFIDLAPVIAADEPEPAGRVGLALATGRPSRPAPATKQPARSQPPRPPAESAEPDPARESVMPRKVTPPRDVAPPAAETPPVLASVPPALPAAEVPSPPPTSRPPSASEAAPGDSPGLLATAPSRAASGNGRAAGERVDARAGDDIAAVVAAQRQSDVALALPGSAGSGSEHDPYVRYGKLLHRRIQDALRYPLQARRQALVGTVTVGLTVLPSGAISSVSVVQSSSHSVLDDAAVEAVRALRPQPFPANLAPRRLTFELPVSFDLK